jgi:broad specificity phosphatase PhoE
LAQEKSKDKEFDNLDAVWSSNYVRTMSTAKYFAHRNNIKVNISELLGERKHGIKSWDELPSDFEVRQFEDENYKIGDGESQKEVRERMYSKLISIIDKNKDKRILIVGHSTATAYLLSNWCEISYDSDYKFNNKTFFDGKWEYLQTFKLTFDDNNILLDIITL